MSEKVREVAIAICKSRTCEGSACCQWPANMGRTVCNAKKGAYDDAAIAAIEAMREPTQDMVFAANRNNHPRDIETYQTMIDAALE
jgi:hypothetical protein